MAIAPALAREDAAEVIDATGRYVSPGFVDMHAHVYWGVNYFAVDAFARAALASRLHRDRRDLARDELLASTGAKARWAPAPVGGRQAPVVATTRAGRSAIPELSSSIGASTGREHVRPA